jgi:hypothetical protein
MRTLHSDYYSALKKPAFSLPRASTLALRHHMLRVWARETAATASAKKNQKDQWPIYL